MVRSTERFDRGNARRNYRNRGVAELIDEWFNPARPRKAIGIEKRNKGGVDLGKAGVASSSWAAIC